MVSTLRDTSMTTAGRADAFIKTGIAELDDVLGGGLALSLIHI